MDRGGGMSGKPRLGGASAPVRRAATQRVYEDFKPTSKWEQDDEQHILTIDLPGFMKEQINVSTEPHNIVRVRGECPLDRNKWSRFQEDYQVPGNSKLNSVRAKFRAGGVLTITVQKEKPGNAKPEEQPHQLPSQTPKQTIPDNGLQDHKITPQEQPHQLPSQTPKQNIPDKGLQDHKITPPPEKKKLPELALPPKASDEQSTMKPDVPKPLASHGPKAFDEKQGMLFKVDKKEDSKKSKEISDENVKKTGDDVEDKKWKGSSSGAVAMEKCRKAVKGLSEMDEERQLLVNMGAAILVIMALSAYVTYQFASREDK